MLTTKVKKNSTDRLITPGDLRGWLTEQHAYAPQACWTRPDRGPRDEPSTEPQYYVLRKEGERTLFPTMLSRPLGKHVRSVWAGEPRSCLWFLRPIDMAARVGLLSKSQARLAFQEAAKWHVAMDEQSVAWDAWLLRSFGIRPAMTKVERVEQVRQRVVRERLLLEEDEVEPVLQAILAGRPPTWSDLADSWVATTAEQALGRNPRGRYSEYVGNCIECGHEFRFDAGLADVFWDTGDVALTENPAARLDECYECSGGGRSPGEKRPALTKA